MLVIRATSFVSFQCGDCFFDLSELLLDFFTAVWSGVQVVMYVYWGLLIPGFFVGCTEVLANVPYKK